MIGITYLEIKPTIGFTLKIAVLATSKLGNSWIGIGGN